MAQTNKDVITKSSDINGQLLAPAPRELLKTGSDSQAHANPKYATGLNAILASAAATSAAVPTDSGIIAPTLVRISNPVPIADTTVAAPSTSSVQSVTQSDTQKTPDNNSNITAPTENQRVSITAPTKRPRPRKKARNTKRVKKIPRCPKCIAAGKVRYHCRQCGGTGICIHGRKKHYCKECGGSQVCKHGRRKSNCKFCLKN